MRSPPSPLTKARQRLVATVHILKGQAGMNDDEYRTMLFAQTGKSSSKDMGIEDLKRVLDHYARLGIKSTARTKLDRVGTSRQRLLAKVHAQLASAGRDTSYLNSMVKRIVKVDAIEFCDEAGLSKLIAALAIDAKRHGRAFP